MIYDPQTSGGLLASIPRKNADKCLQELKKFGYLESRIIGTVQKQGDKPEPIILI